MLLSKRPFRSLPNFCHSLRPASHPGVGQPSSARWNRIHTCQSLCSSRIFISGDFLSNQAVIILLSSPKFSEREKESNLILLSSVHFTHCTVCGGPIRCARIGRRGVWKSQMRISLEIFITRVCGCQLSSRK